MKTDWLSKFVISTTLIDNSYLSEKEKYVLTAYLKQNKTYADIANEINLTDERVRQLIENGFGKIFLSMKALIAKSHWLQKTLIKNIALENELTDLKNNFKKQFATEQLSKVNFEQANIHIDDMRFSVRAKKVLDDLNIKTIKDLSFLTKHTLNSKERVGVKTSEEIIRRAEEYGIKII